MDLVIYNNQSFSISWDVGAGLGKGYFENGKTAFIIDFRKLANKVSLDFLKVYAEINGLGTFALRCFENWAKKNKCFEIYGILVENEKDCSSREDLVKFYSKNDYTIIYEKTSGMQFAKISKLLS